jgi:hypothetical protein
MARLPRFVLPGQPHHITQRGNRRERTFFEAGDYVLYLDLLADAAGWRSGRNCGASLPNALNRVSILSYNHPPMPDLPHSRSAIL